MESQRGVQEGGKKILCNPVPTSLINEEYSSDLSEVDKDKGERATYVN